MAVALAASRIPFGLFVRGLEVRGAPSAFWLVIQGAGMEAEQVLGSRRGKGWLGSTNKPRHAIAVDADNSGHTDARCYITEVTNPQRQEPSPPELKLKQYA